MIFLAALAASVIAMIVALPVALGMWFGRVWPGLGVGAVVAMVAGLGLVAVLGGESAAWVLANAAAGLPVVASALLLRLRVMPAGSMRIATVSGLSAGAQVRLLVVPLVLPAVLAAGAAIFLCVAAELYPGR